MNECVHWPTCSAQHCDMDRKQQPGQGEIATRKAEGEGVTETNTRTWQGNLIQSKTKLDTDRRWLCVLRSPTAIADATMQQRSNPVTVVVRHEEKPHSARSECNMAKCLRHAQGLREKKTIENLWSKGLKEQSGETLQLHLIFKRMRHNTQKSR